MRHSSAVYFVHTKFTSAENAVCLCRCDSSKPKEKQAGCISSIIIVVWTIHLIELQVPPVCSFSFGFHESQFTAYSAFVSPTTVLHGLQAPPAQY